MKRSQSAPWILVAGLGALLLAGVVARAPGGPVELAVMPDGPPLSPAPGGAEPLVSEPSVAPDLIAQLPRPRVGPAQAEAVTLEIIARLPEGLATAPIEVEHLWLAPGEESDATFTGAARGEARAWERARSSTHGAAVFTLDDLQPGRHLFRMRGRGSSVEVFGPFDLAAGDRETLEAALWPGGVLHLELVDAEGRWLDGDAVQGWVAEAYRGEHRQASPRAPRRAERVGPYFEFTRLSEGWQTVVLRGPSGRELELPPVEVGLYGAPARVRFELRLEDESFESAPGMGPGDAPSMVDF